MAGLPGEIEKIILAGDEVVDAVRIAHVGDVDVKPVADVGDVERVAAVFGDEGIDERDVRAVAHEAAREVGTDEAESAGDKNLLALPGGIGKERR